MKIDELVRNLPEITASFYKNILIGSKTTDEFYEISYTGSKVKVSSNKTYQDFIDTIADLNIDLSKERSVIDNNLVLIETKDTYKLVFIIEINNSSSTINNDLKTIIFADDSKVVTNYFKKMFEDKYNILIAENGEEVIKIVEDNKDNISGLFLDLQMPGTSGYQVLDYFSDYDLFDVIPVSIMSGEDGKDNINEIMEKYKIVDMIQKPFDKKSAEAVIEKTLEFGPRS